MCEIPLRQAATICGACLDSDFLKNCKKKKNDSNIKPDCIFDIILSNYFFTCDSIMVIFLKESLYLEIYSDIFTDEIIRCLVFVSK